MVGRERRVAARAQIRQGLKTYANWPTYPQIYLRGKLVGGVDILKEMAANDELGPLREASD